jgi:putative transport protein
MEFHFASWLTSPFMLMFSAVFLGLAFGKISIGKFNFGLSGTLFSGLLIGWLVYSYGDSLAEGHPYYEAAQNMIANGVIPKGYFYLFLILFVAAVGLLASEDIVVVLKKYGAKFIILGFVMTFIGAAATYGMVLIGSGSDNYQIAGTYTGALTSSPGLGAALETTIDDAKHKANNFSELPEAERKEILNKIDPTGELTVANTSSLNEEQTEAFIKDSESGVGLGHAIGYPFGVLIVIFVVNFFPVIFGIDVDKEKKEFNKEMADARAASGGEDIEPVTFDILAFTVVCFLGFSLGNLKIFLGPLGMFGLGTTGSVLVVSLLLGSVGKIGPMTFRMDSDVLGVIRKLSLAFFLAVVGLRYGYNVVDAIMGNGLFLVGVALVVGIVALLVGYIIGRKLFGINWIMLSGALCGGMTSTPGLGAAVDAVDSDGPATGYGAVYPFALMGMVIFTIVLHILPM